MKKIFIILFLDLFAYSTIIPLLPILFLDSDFFLQDVSRNLRLFYLGAVYAIYPLFQLIFSPVWMRIADHKGRVWMLKVSFIGNFLGYLLCAVGIFKGQCVYLFVANALSGALGVNLSTMNAVISDLTAGSKRIKYFGVVNLLLGSAFALGPYLSSYLVSITPHIETVAFSIYGLAAAVAMTSFLLISNVSVSLPKVEPSVGLDVKKLKKEAFMPLLLVFLTTFGWYLFIKTFQIFLLESRHLDSSSVLKMVAFYGLSTVVAQGAFVSKFYKKLSGPRSLGASLIGLGLFIALFIINPGFLGLHVHLAAIAFFQSMISPNLLAIFSKNHTPEVHGQMMSAHLGVASFAKISAPLVSGWLLAVNPSLSISLSSAIFLGSFALVPFLFQEKSQELVSEDS